MSLLPFDGGLGGTNPFPFGGGMIGGMAPAQQQSGGRSWQDVLAILGAMLQDTGAAYNGRPGGALQGVQKEFKRLGDQKQYQDMVGGMFGPQAMTPDVQITPGQATGGVKAVNGQLTSDYDPGKLNVQSNGMMFKGPASAMPQEQAQMLAQILPTMTPGEGTPMIVNAMGQAFDRKDRKEERQQTRDYQVADREAANKLAQVRPLPLEDRARYGISPNAPAVIDGNGKVSILNDPNQITAYQQEMLARQKASDAETARHNRAQEQSGREGEGGLFSMIDTPNGMFGVTRGAGVIPMKGPDGKPLVSYHSDVGLRYDMGAAQAGGSAGGAVAEALPTTEAAFNQINKTIAGFRTPEVKAQAGRSLGFIDSRLPTIPGYNSDFNNRFAQLQGQTFLQAFNSLRGTGAITEVEGEKATNAIARLNRASSEKEFYQALDDAESAFAQIQGAVRQRAARGAVVPKMGGGQQPANRPDPLGLR